MIRNVRAASVAVLMVSLGGCATKEQEALGNVIRGGDVPVYQGDIKRNYNVIQSVSEKRQQICGPMYYDDTAGAAWMAGAGKTLGADAIINYRSERTAMSLFSCGTFAAFGTAVKFAK